MSSDYDYANELIEQCEKRLERTEVKIAKARAWLSEGQKELQALLNHKAGIELAMSQLKVHAPRSWCHFCKKDCPKPWDHLPRCNKYVEEDDE